MAWLTGWTYRKSITLSRASGAVTNYQLLLKVGQSSGAVGEDVDCNNHCLDTFNDLRFTASNGTSLLDYWIMSITGASPNKLATIWIEFDSIGTGATTFYMYYGKADAPAYSNFDDTFIFGDPFNDPSLDTDRWPSVTGNPTYSIDDTNHYLQLSNMDGTNWQNGKGFHSKAVSLPAQWMVDDPYGNAQGYMQYQSTTVVAQMGEVWLILNDAPWGSPDYGIAFEGITEAYASYQRWNVFAGVGGGMDYIAAAVDSAEKTLRAKMYKLANYIHVETDGVLRLDEANMEAINIVHMGFSRYSTNALATLRMGAFVIRNYYTPEPAWGSWGGEQTNYFSPSPMVTSHFT
jgi:hypothetical protein